MTSGARVLIVGLDPRAVPGIDAETIEPLGQIERAVVGEPWDVVVIGRGIRKPEPLLELFEAVVNLVHTLAPKAKIAFNTDGGSSLEAVQRVIH